MMLAVHAQLQNQRTRMLILDEFTHVIEDRTELFTKKVVRELKGFISENVCDIVFVGTEEIVQIIDLYAQIQRRQGQGEVHMTPFDHGDENDEEEWGDLLETISDELPIPPAIPLHDHRFRKRLHVASGGLVNPLMKLLLLASLNALELGDDELREEHLWQGYENGRTIFARRHSDKKSEVKFDAKIERTVNNPFTQPPRKKSKPRVLKSGFTPSETDKTYLSQKRPPKIQPTFRK